MLLEIVKKIAKWKKISCIPPIFYENKFIGDFKEKSEVFNTFSCKTVFATLS